MYSENSISPIRPTFLRNDSTQFNQRKETFREIFQRTLSSKSNSRPPKIELTGILVPCERASRGHLYKFKLETDSGDYFLHLSDTLLAVAKKIEWEEVTVKGYLDFNAGVFEVEKINRTHSNEPPTVAIGVGNSYFEFDWLRRTIAQQGKLSLSPEMAS